MQIHEHIIAWRWYLLVYPLHYLIITIRPTCLKALNLSNACWYILCVCKIKSVFSITFFVTWWHNYIYMEWEFYNSAGISKNNIYVFTLLVCENGINFSLTLLSGIRLPLWDPVLICMAAMAVCSSSVSMWQRQQQRSEATSIGMYFLWKITKDVTWFIIVYVLETDLVPYVILESRR